MPDPNYDINDVDQGIRKAVTGIDNAVADGATDVALARLQTLHVWLRLQNQYNNQVNTDPALVKLDELKAALRLVSFVLLKDLDATAKAKASFANNNAGVYSRAPSGLILADLRDNIPNANDLTNYFADANACLTEIQTHAGIDEYAQMLLADINTYIQRHGLSAITNDPAEQDKIYEQLAIVNPPFDALKDGGSNFLLRGMILCLTFPIALPFAGLSAMWASGYNATPGKTGVRHYGRQVTEILNRRDERGRALEDILPSFTIQQFTFRGKQYGPYNNIRPVHFVLHVAEAGVNALTGIVFQTLRYLFSYDSWQPQNKRRFDSIEKGIFNVVFSPVILALGLGRAIVDTYNNSKELYAEQDYDNTNLLDDQHSPYGLGMLRFFKWIDNSPNFKKYTGYVLTAVFAPFVLIMAVVNRGLTASGRQPLTLPTMSPRAKIILAMIMSPIMWPVDLFVGTILHGARAFGQKVTDGFEKGFHKFISQIWASFLLTTMGPMVWGGALAVLWTPVIEFANVFLHGISGGAVPMLKAGEVFAGIFKYTGGLGAKELFWGTADKAGILAVGAKGFAAGMKTLFTGMFSAQTWAPVVKFFSGLSFAKLGTAMESIAYLTIPLAIGAVARGWDNTMTGVRSIFGNWGKPASPGVDAADKATKYASLDKVNPVPVQTQTPPPPPPGGNNGSDLETGAGGTGLGNSSSSSAPSSPVLKSTGGFVRNNGGSNTGNANKAPPPPPTSASTNPWKKK